MKTSRYAFVAVVVIIAGLLFYRVPLQFAQSTIANEASLWVATIGQLYKLDADEGRIDARPGNTSSIVRLVVDESDGTVWGYSRGNLSAYDHAGNLLSSSTVPQTPAASNHLALAVDSTSGHVWLAIDKRLHHFSDHGQLLKTFTLEDEAQDLSFDPNTRKLWVATETTVKALDASGSLIQTLGLPKKSVVQALAVDRGSSSLWVALGDSLRLYNSAGTQILQKSIKVLNRLADDGDHGIWAASGHRLLRISATGQILVDRIPLLITIDSMTVDRTDHSVWVGGLLLVRHVDANGRNLRTFTLLRILRDIALFISPSQANRPPVAVNDSANTSINTVIPIQVLSNDSDPDGDTLTITAVTQGTHGAVTNTNSTATYTPANNFHGTDSFTYSVSDGKDGNATATVNVTVDQAPVVNAGIDQVLVFPGAASLTGVVTDDGLPNPPGTLTTTWSKLSGPGNVTFGNAGALSTVASFSQAGVYILRLTANDGFLSGSDDIQVIVNIAPPVNRNPVALNDSALTAQNTALQISLLSNDSDPDGDKISITQVTNGGNGSVTHNGITATYTPNNSFSGTDTFDYTISDGRGGMAGALVTVTVDQPPQVNAGPDQTVILPAGAALVGIVSDDGLPKPPAMVSMEWNVIGGPAPVAFGNINSASTSASFTQAGIYLLRLTANDGFLSAFDEVQITVNAQGGGGGGPTIVAPPLDRSVATMVAAATEFLYSGANPIQTGVTPGTIEKKRAAVLRGRLTTRDGNALSGATVTIFNRPEFGQTLTRADGNFDLAVNGGGPLTINYSAAGYLPAQRQVDVPWQNYVPVPETALIPVDPQVTTLTANAAVMQVHQSNVMTDSDGSRRTTLLFPAGTTASMIMPGGAAQALGSLGVRATEYTVGTNGPRSMPAALPPTSGYTYAFELSVDEAISSGATQVVFSQPLPVYVDNFLNFPVGIEVPLGFYDRQKNAWVASDNGRVVRIVNVAGGVAEVDTDGNGSADNGLGMTQAERQQLALLYAAGTTLWRMPIPHFSPWDSNWPYGPPPDAEPPSGPPPGVGDPPDDEECEVGSIIECQGQILGETIPVIGTPFSLNYSTDRVIGRAAARAINIPLSGATLPPSAKGIEVEISVGGQRIVQTFPALANQATTFVWDGKDAFGRDLQGRQKATVRLGYSYDGVYQRAERFGYNGNGIPITGSRTRQEVTLNRVTEAIIGPWDARQQGLGGWSLDMHHAYDPIGRILYRGNGTRSSVQTINAAISTVAGSGVQGFSGDGGPATQAALSFPLGVALDAQGRVYIADVGNRVVRRVNTDGTITTIAGIAGTMCNPTTAPCGDGGQASAALLHSPVGLAVGPDGSLFIQDAGAKRTRRVALNGIITTVAGSGNGCAAPTASCGDGGPATAAQLGAGPDGPQYVAVTADGTLYITDGPNHRVRRVTTDGIISTLAGSGASGCSNNGVVATAACLGFPWGIAAASDGSVYISDMQLHQLFRIGVNGIITRIAGNGSCGNGGDGGAAGSAILCQPEGLALAPDGSLYFADFGNSRIRKIGSNGIINTVAGTGVAGFSGDGGVATSAQVRNPISVTVGVDAAIYIGDGNNQRVRKITAPLPGFTDTDIVIPADDGSQLFQFSSEGRHLRTIHTLTAATLLTFAYDSAGRLASIVDGDNNVTGVQRDGNGNPTGITSPFGQVTALTVDANGYLASIANPANEAYVATYSSDGLMLAFRDPKNQSSHMTYDTLGRLATDSDAAGGSQTLARMEFPGGYEVSRTTAMNRVTRYSVEELANGSRRRTTILPNGLNEISLESANGVNATTSANGMITTATLGPDPRFGMQTPVLAGATFATPGNNLLTMNINRTATLSTPGNPLSLLSQNETVSINGRVYSSIYNAATRTKTSTTPQGRQNTLAIDLLGRPSQTQEGNLLATSLSHDNRGRPATIIQGTGAQQRLTTLSYNPQGLLSNILDPEGRLSSFSYDLAGRMLTETRPDGKVTSYDYDANGNLTAVTPPGRPSHVFSYSPADVNADYRPPTVAGGGTNQTLYAYNLDQQIDLITRPDGATINYAYDGAGRLSTITTPAPGGLFTYGYSPTTGNLSNINAPGNLGLSSSYDGSLLKDTSWSGSVSGTVSRAHDISFRVTNLSVNGNGIAFAYDNDSLLTQAGALTLTRHPQHGLVTGTTLSAITDTWGYSGFGEVTNYAAAVGGSGLYDVQLARDRLGRVTKKIETVSGTTNTYDYTYDMTGRLARVQTNNLVTATYNYDENGNRLAGPGFSAPTYDDQDRLVSRNANISYTYSPNGELASRSVGASATNYQYDVLGNLRSVVLPSGVQIVYLIDGQNRRVGKLVDGTPTQGFLYENQLRVAAELDGSNSIVSRFVYASRSNVPDYMIRAGTTFRLINDQLGSVKLVVNAATGIVAQRLDYDEFGRVTQDTNPGFQPFGFAGGLYDFQTGLVRFGNRDYDSDIGRWTAKDPLLVSAGDTNVYGYVLGDPINLVDPYGLQGGIGFGGGLLKFNPVDLANQVTHGGDAAQILALEAVVQSVTNQILDIRKQKADLLKNKCKPDDPRLKALDALDRLLSDQIKNLKQYVNNLQLNNPVLKYKPVPYPNPFGPITSVHP